MNVIQLAKSMVPRPVRGIIHGSLRKQAELRQSIRNRYEGWMSRNYYGNTVEYWANVKGVNNWDASRACFTEGMDRELHERFMKLGYADLSEGSDPDTIRLFQQRFQRAIVDPQQSCNPYENRDFLQSYSYGRYETLPGEFRRNLLRADKVYPDYSLLFNDKLKYLIQSCMGSSFKIDVFIGYRNIYCPPDILKHCEPHSNRWHFDDQVADGMHLFVYLSDVESGCGGFQCFDREYSRFLLKKGYSKEARKFSETGGLDLKLFDTPRKKVHTGPAGTMILCTSSFCLHRAGDFDPGKYRDVILFTLRPSTQKTSLSSVASAAAA